MAELRAVLQRCDPDLLDSCRDSDQLDCAEAARMVLYLTDGRRVQKVLGRQLFVLDSMMSLLEGLQSARQLMTQACPPPPGGGARARWKALKSTYRSHVEVTESLLRTLQEKIHNIQDKRHTLSLLVTQLHTKKQQYEQLEESLQKAQNALRLCDDQLTRLRAEHEAAVGHVTSWERLREDLQAFVSANQDVMQMDLLTFDQSQLCVELRPRPSSGPSSNQPEPLRLTVTWSHGGRFTLRSGGGVAGLLEDGVTGRGAELSAVLLDVMHTFLQQFQLLAEVHGLRSSFAIDWRPAHRELVYLKTAVLVVRLQVEDGYPTRGRARLLSVHRDGRAVDTSSLQPPKDDLSLTDWLIFLQTSPLI